MREDSLLPSEVGSTSSVGCFFSGGVSMSGPVYVCVCVCVCVCERESIT